MVDSNLLEETAPLGCESSPSAMIVTAAPGLKPSTLLSFKLVSPTSADSLIEEYGRTELLGIDSYKSQQEFSFSSHLSL
jgi:hypothetical protein